jgi:hypothetical protein
MMVEVWRRKEKPFGRKLRFFASALSGLLSEEELREIYDIISDDLKNIQDDDEMLLSLQATPPAFWPHYSETARLRIENRLIAAAKAGKYSARLNRCTAGALGTWLPTVIHPSLSTELGKVIATKLGSGDREEEAYVFQYFFHRLPALYPSCNRLLRQAIIGGLKAGKTSFYEAVGIAIEENEQWNAVLEEEYAKFKPAGEPDDDEIPF